MNKPLILAVEDDRPVRTLIATTLKAHGYRHLEAATGEAALLEASSHNPDIILLDLGLPDLDGVEVITRIRAWSNAPIIVISARSEDADKISALDAGADDYLTKPFHLAELNARVKSLIRRRQAKGDVTVTLGNLLLYPDKRQVEINGKPLQLNRKEFDLLYYFVVNPGRVINKMSLAESVWGDNIDQADSLDFIYSQVKNLRKKLKQAEATIELKAVYGFGYKLSEL